MKRSILNYYEHKFEAAPKLSFDECFHQQIRGHKLFSWTAGKVLTAASLACIILVLGINNIDNKLTTYRDQNNIAKLSVEEFTSLPTRQEFQELIDIYNRATETTSFNEADLTELINALDLLETNIDIDSMNTREKVTFFDFRGNLSLRDGNVETAIEYFEKVVVIEELPDDVRQVFQESLDRSRDALQNN